MSDLLERLRAAVDDERMRALDLALAEWCLRHGGSAPVALAMALTSRALGDGHSCLALEAGAMALPEERPIYGLKAVRDALRVSGLVGDAGSSRPMIHDGGRLYLHRYWVYETQLAASLRKRLDLGATEVAVGRLEPEGGIFDYDWIEPGDTNWQAVAAFCALRQRFAVISGGPGTGKTYTVLRLISLLLEAARSASRPPPRIRLAAPTGKAAARMMSSIHQGLEEFPDGESLAAHLPREASTLHRLLGLRREGTRPAHDAARPLPADAVIVDEASMVDLPMMAKLAAAIPEDARLILLGDRYQLASVESGSVLADLCAAAGCNTFSAAMRASAATLLGRDAPGTAAGEPLADHVVTLQSSHRFRPDSPIGQLAAAVNAGDAEVALGSAEAAAACEDTGVRFERDGVAQVEAMVAAYRPMFSAAAPAAALDILEAVRMLTATRVGPDGADALNQRIHERLAACVGFDPQRRWYHGRPVIVLRNDYRAGLSNGDTGICFDAGDGRLRVWFRTANGVRSFLPTGLPEHETVYAMTVHKSQGSEFDRVHLLLPATDLAVVTRELVYTGITRARSHLVLAGRPDVIRAAIARTVKRHSGLAERLAKEAGGCSRGAS